MNLSAFILAAGIGERLQPITNYLPKPLLPILGKPVLQSVLEKVISLPVSAIGINLHHKRTIIENWINTSAYSKKTHLYPEDPILGTGGALKNAEVFLKRSPFLVHNSDIISDIDLRNLSEFHISSRNLATLAVHDYPEFNRLMLDKDDFLSNIVKHPHPYPPPSRGKEVEESAHPSGRSAYVENSPSSGGRGIGGGGIESKKVVAFTGIAVYQPEFLQFLPKGSSSVVDAWFNALSAGYRIGTMDVSGCYWTDIGTPAAYAKAVIHELRENGETVYIHQSFKGCRHTELDGYVVIEKDSELNEGVTLRNCIALPGTTIGQTSADESSPECFQTLFWGSRDNVTKKKGFEHCLLGPDFTVKLSESDFYNADDHDTFLIGTGGSDRKYYRVKKNYHSAVLMHCAENDPDFQRHIEYTVFFRTYAVPVPELITAETRRKTASFEDLGDLSLYSWLKCLRSAEQVEEMYRRVLDILISIHTIATAHVHECPLLKGRIFDYEHLRWETTYFLERFVEGIKNKKVDNTSSLNNEFHNLAIAVDSFPKTIVHRDFQSQNIMITKGGNPRVLDYQGARIGPPAYDVVALLWDPYYRLEDALRERLLEYYIHKIIPPFSKGGQGGITEKEFRQTILPCRLQRHMQALGAYGFLTTAKGKKYFMNHIPEGVRLLKEDVSHTGIDYPELHRLVMGL